jgi:hypothetical protein
MMRYIALLLALAHGIGGAVSVPNMDIQARNDLHGNATTIIQSMTAIPTLAAMRPFPPVVMHEDADILHLDTRSSGIEKAEKRMRDEQPEKADKKKEEEERMYSQTELYGVAEEKRALLNWVKQMEYAGTTFFDG